MTTEEKIKYAKGRFMALRNGIIADVYRKAGISCYHVIYGLNLPQLKALAKELGKDEALARKLWEDRNVRESRLLSTWLWPEATVTDQLKQKLLEESQTKEERDYLLLNLPGSVSRSVSEGS